MNVASNSDKASQHPFGGCNRLLEQYRTIGRALLAHERGLCPAFIPSGRAIREFSTSVSFVPVEVLETYLDDLLDLGVSDEGLFIRKPKTTWRGVVLLLAAVTVLLAWQTQLTAAHVPVLLAVTFLAGIGSTLYFLPRTKAIRRFSFATLVSHEIGNRRGQDKTRMGTIATRFLIGEMWRFRDYSTSKPLPSQYAQVRARYFH